MNAIGYDAVTLGNHEFNYGIPCCASVVKQMKAPVLAANAVVGEERQAAHEPYIIKDDEGHGARPVRSRSVSSG